MKLSQILLLAILLALPGCAAGIPMSAPPKTPDAIKSSAAIVTKTTADVSALARIIDSMTAENLAATKAQAQAIASQLNSDLVSAISSLSAALKQAVADASAKQKVDAENAELRKADPLRNALYGFSIGCLGAGIVAIVAMAFFTSARPKLAEAGGILMSLAIVLGSIARFLGPIEQIMIALTIAGIVYGVYIICRAMMLHHAATQDHVTAAVGAV
jgi:hypothetical protein